MVMSILQRNNLAKAKGAFTALTTLNKNKAAEVFYREAVEEELDKFNAALIKEIEKVYTPIFVENSKYSTGLTGRKPSRATISFILGRFRGKNSVILTRNLRKIVGKFMRKATKEAKKTLSDALQKEFGKSFRLQWSEQDYDETLKAMVSRNVALIKNVSDQTVSNIENIVYDAMTTGQGWKEIKDSLAHQKEVSNRRIKTIARDQTAKTNAALNYLEQQSAGVEYFRWKTAGDERVSTGKGGHKQLDGKIYRWDDEKNYPEIDSYGNRGLPSQRVNCYHKDTEILTKDGFKLIKDVSVGEMVASINPETKRFEWKKCSAIYSKFEKNIAVFESKIFKLRTSLDHRFFLYRKKYAGKRLVPNSQYPEFVEGVNKLSFKNSEFFASSENWEGKNIEDWKGIPVDIFCKFMGYYLSDGSVDKRTNNAIHIANSSNEEMFNELKESLVVRQGKEKLYIYNKELFSLVSPLGRCNEKYIPEEVKNLPKEKIRLFLDSFASCDGTPAHKHIGFNGQEMSIMNKYYTTSYKMASDLVECIYKSGNSASITIKKSKGKEVKFRNGTYTLNYDVYVVSELKTKTRSIRRGFHIEEYNDYVYDIEVDDNHTLLVKDGKSIHWNSNCRCVAQAVFLQDGWRMKQNPDGSYTPVKIK